MYTESLGAKLKKAREQTGFSQQEVSIETKLTQDEISRFERNDRRPTLEKIGTLADFYGVSVDWLLGTRGGKKEIELRNVQ